MPRGATSRCKKGKPLDEFSRRPTENRACFTAFAERNAMKSKPSDLAILGAPPAFTEPLHVGRPNMGDRARFLELVNGMLDRRWFSNNGPYVQELEKRIAEYVDARYCIAMCNATTALEISIRALGLSGEVIIPAFTFVATAHALKWQEITPVFCDVLPGGVNLDPASVQQLITPRTTGIIGVHLFGRPCNVEALSEIADRHSLALMFDAAHAFGCTHGNRPVGAFGRLEVFSFHATKFFNSFEGGCVTTNDKNLAEKIRLMKNFGFVGYDQVDHIGINGKMSEISAAFGLVNMDSLDELIRVNKAHFNTYAQRFVDLEGIDLFLYDDKEKYNYQYIAVRVDEKQAGISRDLLLKTLHAENILARRYFYPGCHKLAPYRDMPETRPVSLNNTETLAREILILPTGNAITQKDIHMICNTIKTALEQAGTLRAAGHEMTGTGAP